MSADSGLVGAGADGPAVEAPECERLNPQWLAADPKGKELCARLGSEVFPSLSKAIDQCANSHSVDTDGAHDGGDAATSTNCVAEIESFITYYSSYERFCEVEELIWFKDVWTLAVPVIALLRMATTEKADLLGLSLVHIVCRDERAFKRVVEFGGVDLILAKLDQPDRLHSVTLCRAAMLAVGNITFQLSQDFAPAQDCLPYVTKVLTLHMDVCPETTEAALWALANVYYSETLAVTPDVVKLVLAAMVRHRDHISVVCEGVYCLHNFSCSRVHQDMILEMGLVDILMDCFLNFKSARFVYPAIELVKIFCGVKAAVVQISGRILDLLHLNQLDSIEPYDFGSNSSYAPRLAMWRRNWHAIIAAVTDLSLAEQPHPVLQHKQTASSFLCVYQRPTVVPSLLELASKAADPMDAPLLPRPATVFLQRKHKCTQCETMHARPYAHVLEPVEAEEWVLTRTNVHCVCSFNCFMSATGSVDTSELVLMNPKAVCPDAKNCHRRT